MEEGAGGRQEALNSDVTIARETDIFLEARHRRFT